MSIADKLKTISDNMQRVYDAGRATGGGSTPAPTLQANFADNTWENIIWACQNNAVPDTWVVGDTKVMDFSGEDVTIAICGKGVDEYADGGVAPLTFCNFSVIQDIGSVKMANSPCIFPFEEHMYKSVIPHIEELVSSDIKNAIRSVKKTTRYGICPRTYDDDTAYLMWVDEYGYQQNITIETAERFFLFSSEEANKLFNIYNSGIEFFLPPALNEPWLRDNAIDERDTGGLLTWGGGYGNFKVALADEYDGVYEIGGEICTQSNALLFGFCF
jgi:hypothetical protein